MELLGFPFSIGGLKGYSETAEGEKDLGRVREAIWTLYDKVKQASCTQTGKEGVYELYDKLAAMRSISPGVNEVIASFAQYREKMLKALDHPGLPLHNNSERDIRGVAKRRNISESTKSKEGKSFRDGLITLKQTCARHRYKLYGILEKMVYARAGRLGRYRM